MPHKMEMRLTDEERQDSSWTETFPQPATSGNNTM